MNCVCGEGVFEDENAKKMKKKRNCACHALKMM